MSKMLRTRCTADTGLKATYLTAAAALVHASKAKTDQTSKTDGKGPRRAVSRRRLRPGNPQEPRAGRLCRNFLRVSSLLSRNTSSLPTRPRQSLAGSSQ
ncbi:hypothetical protein FA95DRAFT_225444 [Auriscalpium vulgare]|uniref:Uncharacterized protein n=1 Tax=Auriscalpium vulgare TaxID=40419 RepID=A0ACB8RLB3_9AGAM|nr:hypothetical protein FA95DRAFT_225444 [Auriscalpium vulgare]